MKRKRKKKKTTDKRERNKGGIKLTIRKGIQRSKRENKTEKNKTNLCQGQKLIKKDRKSNK